MKRERMMSFILAGGVFLLPLVCAALPDDHPYKSIITRNSFSLIPPPPPAPATAPTPPSNVKLTGISTLFGDKRAMLMVQDTSGPGKPDLSVILREGQRDGQIEVVAIDVDEGSVKIKNAGADAVLTFDANGVKLPSLPVATTAERVPNAIPAPPRPGGGPSPTMTAIGQPQPHGGLRQIPTRQLRLPSGNATPSTVAPQSTAPASQMSQQQIDEARAAQQINMLQNELNNPDGPPMPPTELKKLMQEEGQ